MVNNNGRFAAPGNGQNNPRPRAARPQPTPRPNPAARAQRAVAANPAQAQRPHARKASGHHAARQQATAYRRPVAGGHAASSRPATRVYNGAQYASAPRRTNSNGGGYRGPSRGGTKVAAAVALVVVLGIALVGCYWTMWRNINVTVNGKEATVRIGSNMESFLKDNDYFGVKPGRHMSVGGNVLDKTGGTRCTVKVGDKEIKAGKLAQTEVVEGSSIAVADGTDTTEEYTEESEKIAPQAEMEVGGAIQYVSQWGKPGKKSTWTGKESGEVVDKGVTQEVQNMVIASRNVEPKGEGKYVALTFDDGPSQYTGQILDILNQYNAHATFYNLGQNAEGLPKEAKRIVDEGHELASHTNSHQNLPTVKKDTLRSEISSAFDTLKAASGKNIQMIRAPYGAFTKTEWLRSADLISCNVLWNIDTLDWELPGPDKLVDTVVENAYNGAIILMHDGGGNREDNVKALPGILQGLQDEGYKVLTVSELMSKDENFPKDVVKGKVKVPKGAVIPKE